jgi:hypothetical protein
VQKSFSTADQQSIMLSASIDIFGFTVNKETSTYSNTWTEEQDTSSSVAISQTTTSSATLKGYSDPKNGVNHDYDYINVWVNPLATFVIYPLQQGNLVQWTGYGYDLNDTKAAPDMDVIGVQLGCLNGDFYKKYSSGANKNWLTCVDLFNNNFNRSWAQKNTDGSSPALTPTLAKSVAPYDFCTQKGTDLYNICQADPFSNPTYAKGEIPPAAGLFTTKDGRFTACQNQGCSTTIDYQPGKCPLTYSQAYSTTLTQGQGYKNTYSESFSLASQFSEKGGSGKIFALTLSATLSTKNTLTWVEQFNQTTNNSQGQMASFSICGPAEGYQGPQQFVVYQDNLYGTFMFYPGN